MSYWLSQHQVHDQIRSNMPNIIHWDIMDFCELRYRMWLKHLKIWTPSCFSMFIFLILLIPTFYYLFNVHFFNTHLFYYPLSGVFRFHLFDLADGNDSQHIISALLFMSISSRDISTSPLTAAFPRRFIQSLRQKCHSSPGTFLFQHQSCPYTHL